MELNMKEIILAKYGEIILKGLNRPVFEDRLMRNIKQRLGETAQVRRMQATHYITPAQGASLPEIFAKLQKTFGIVSVAKAIELPKDMAALEGEGVDYVASALRQAKTFKIEAKRADKNFPFKSPEICARLGQVILENFSHLQVDVHRSDVVVMAEIRDTHAYMYCEDEKQPGPGGMPTGSNGRAALLLSGGIDSPVAGYMMAKRGLLLDLVHFYSYPYTSERAKDKVIALAKILKEYIGPMRMLVVPFTDIQLKINQECPPEQLTIIMRRVMMQIAERLALKQGGKALITGESLGQVASQTMESLGVTNAAVSLPVFRPLIGMDKEEIVVLARKIGTFETSILPYEDCCTVFTPKHPNTKPVLERILDSQEKAALEPLMEEALASVETILI